MVSKKLYILLLLVAVVIIYSYFSIGHPAPVFYRKRLLGGYNARTIPPFGIYIAAQHIENCNLLQHEKRHWQQYQEMGLFSFYLNYFWAAITRGYDLNPLEIDARSNENDFCKVNYTECVRKGLSATIYDPNFRVNN